MAEINECIKSLKENKSPGSDGLTGEFYKTFNLKLAPFLLAMFKAPSYIKARSNHINSQTKKKDRLHIANWRPISLLNNDAKLFALIFARRLKHGLDQIIDIEQSGFIQKRHISKTFD